MKDKVIFCGNKLKEVENRRRHFNYQKFWGTVQHDKQKKKQICSYYCKKAIMFTTNKQKYQNLKSLSKMGRSSYMLCAIVANIED